MDCEWGGKFFTRNLGTHSKRDVRPAPVVLDHRVLVGLLQRAVLEAAHEAGEGGLGALFAPDLAALESKLARVTERSERRASERVPGTFRTVEPSAGSGPFPGAVSPLSKPLSSASVLALC